MKAYFLAIPLLLSSCDFFGFNRVDVAYTLTSGENAVADVTYFNKNGEKVTEVDVQPGWRYSFRAKEGSQLLYLQVANVRNATMRARIRVEGEVINDIVVREGGLKGVSAWGMDAGIKIYYTMQSGHAGYALFRTPDGTDSLSIADFNTQQGSTSLEQKEYTVDAGFESNISIFGNGISSGDTCLFARIEFEPMLNERLDLISSERCGSNRTSVGITATIPGFQLIP